MQMLTRISDQQFNLSPYIFRHHRFIQLDADQVFGFCAQDFTRQRCCADTDFDHSEESRP